MSEESSRRKRPRLEDGDVEMRAKCLQVARSVGNSTPELSSDRRFASEDWLLRDLKPMDSVRARTIDTIHETIYLEPVISEILDTPQMQRLKDLKQLGLAYNVYINANHTRFEHSAGVMHLAEKFGEALKKKQPILGISSKDILCLKIAGLCHDLGHGPFSHVFDGEFRKQLKKTGRIDEDDNWKHEEASLMMFDSMLGHLGLQIDMDNLDKPLRQIGDGIRSDTFGVFGSDEDEILEFLTSRDMVFVKECILGGPLANEGQIDFIGRGWDKEFLYDVVNNRFSGLDVDKMDYFARDQKHTLGGGVVDAILIDEAYVAQGDCPLTDCFRCKNYTDSPNKVGCSISKGRHLMICFPSKIVPKAVNFFRKRFDLHSQVYSHKTAKSYEYLVCDALVKADEHFEFRASDGRIFRGISNTVRDPSAYLVMTDDIINHIERSTSEKLVEAQEMIRRYRSRDHYRLVASQRLNSSKHQDLWLMNEGAMKNEILDVFDRENQSLTELSVLSEDSAIVEEIEEEEKEKDREGSLDATDFIMEVRTIHCGRGEQNPVKAMRFLGREDLIGIRSKSPSELPLAKEADEDSYLCHMQQGFLEKSIRVFCCASKGEQEKHALVKKYFDTWLDEKTGSMKTDITLSQS